MKLSKSYGSSTERPSDPEFKKPLTRNQKIALAHIVFGYVHQLSNRKIARALDGLVLKGCANSDGTLTDWGEFRAHRLHLDKL